MNQRRPQGFTFVELMIVATIIAILAAIAVPNFLEARIRATVSRSKADLALLHMAVEAYRLETKMYPPNSAVGKPSPWDLTVITTPIAYLAHLPVDPFTDPSARRFARDAQPQSLPFQYLNGIQADPKRGIAPEEPAYLPGFSPAIAWGLGPAGRYEDGINLSEPGVYSTLVRPDGKLFMLVYDPTNGSASGGDIYQRMP